MLVEAIVLALVVGKLAGGSLKRLADLHFRRVEWIVLAFFVQEVSLRLSLRGVEWATEVGPFVYPATFVVLLIALVPNLRRWEMKLVAFGVLLNFVAITLNGGRMPLSVAGLEAIDAIAMRPLIDSGAYFTSVIMTGATRLGFLGDIFPLPAPYPRPQVFSVGDAMMSLGLFLLVVRYMRGRGDRAMTAERVSEGERGQARPPAATEPRKS